APVAVGDETVDLGEFPGKQAHEVHHVDALIEQHPAPGDDTPGSPVVLVERDQLRFAVYATHVDDATKLAGADQAHSILHGLVITVVEAIHQLEARMLFFTAHHARDIVHV